MWLSVLRSEFLAFIAVGILPNKRSCNDNVNFISNGSRKIALDSLCMLTVEYLE
jgi:hypothetical protein